MTGSGRGASVLLTDLEKRFDRTTRSTASRSTSARASS